MIKIGDKDVKKIYVGDKPVKKVMLGDKQIWPAEQLTAPADDPIWFDRKFWAKNTEGRNYDDFAVKPIWMVKEANNVVKVIYEYATPKQNGAESELWAWFNWNVNARKANPMVSTNVGNNTGYMNSYFKDRFHLYYSETLKLWILDNEGRTNQKECFPICFTEAQCQSIEPYIGGSGPA